MVNLTHIFRPIFTICGVSLHLRGAGGRRDIGRLDGAASVGLEMRLLSKKERSVYAGHWGTQGKVKNRHPVRWVAAVC